MRFAAALVAFMLSAGGTALAADLYKWQDEDGVTRYSDQMPPPGAKNLQKLKSTANLLAAERSASPMSDDTRAAAKKLPITLYSFDDCGELCKKAQAFLDKRGVPYTLKDTNEDKIQLQKLTGKLEAPALMLGNTAPVVGFDESRWHKELDLAGYAKSNPYLKPGASMAVKPQPKTPPVAEASQENRP